MPVLKMVDGSFAKTLLTTIFCFKVKFVQAVLITWMDNFWILAKTTGSYNTT